MWISLCLLSGNCFGSMITRGGFCFQFHFVDYLRRETEWQGKFPATKRRCWTKIYYYKNFLGISIFFWDFYLEGFLECARACNWLVSLNLGISVPEFSRKFCSFLYLFIYFFRAQKITFPAVYSKAVNKTCWAILTFKAARFFLFQEATLWKRPWAQHLAKDPAWGRGYGYGQKTKPSSPSQPLLGWLQQLCRNRNWGESESHCQRLNRWVSREDLKGRWKKIRIFLGKSWITTPQGVISPREVWSSWNSLELSKWRPFALLTWIILRLKLHSDYKRTLN